MNLRPTAILPIKKETALRLNVPIVPVVPVVPVVPIGQQNTKSPLLESYNYLIYN